MNNKDRYGECAECDGALEPVWYIEYERDEDGILTGRQRHDVDYLVCPYCGKRYCVDDSFAMPWHY
jgi:uncharacterized protein with PIN domain